MFDREAFKPRRVEVAYIKALDTERYKGEPTTTKRDAPKYTVCKLTYMENRLEQVVWIFEPMWDEIDKAPAHWYHLVTNEIAGLDMRTREKEYVYFDKIPPFIYQRVPPREREDVLEHVKQFADMEYFDAFDYLVKTTLYTGHFVAEDNPINSEGINTVEIEQE